MSSDEQVGRDFARMLRAPKGRDPLVDALHPSPEPTEPEPTDPPRVSDSGELTDEDRVQAARLLELDPRLAHMLKGDTVQELVASAAEMAATLDRVRRERHGQAIDFDGGARTPLPEPGDPEAEHGQFLAGLLKGDLSEYEWNQRRRYPGGQ